MNKTLYLKLEVFLFQLVIIRKKILPLQFQNLLNPLLMEKTQFNCIQISSKNKEIFIRYLFS